MTFPIPRKTGLYGNSVVRDKTGEIIFRTSEKRCKWYIDRGLATFHTLDDGGYDITLTFDTNGPGNKGDEFYLQRRYNICVVCLEDKYLTRHFIVPLGLRKHLPPQLKDHSYFDVVLICTGCYQQAVESRDATLKQLLEVHKVDNRCIWNKAAHIERLKARNAARALLRHSDKIPLDRQAALKMMIMDVFPGIELRKSNLQHIDSMLIPKPAVRTPEKVLVERFNADQTKLLKFVIWPFRNSFLASMKPKCMPRYWNPERTER